jgi:hypothetical protein
MTHEERADTPADLSTRTIERLRNERDRARIACKRLRRELDHAHRMLAAMAAEEDRTS